MNSMQWLRYFEQNRRNRSEPQWDEPSLLPASVAAPLARSLSHFQLGESGDGAVLLAGARRAHSDDPAWVEALALFVAEENEHARLLEQLVARFGGTLIDQHWTHAGFRVVRQALGVRFEIQILLVAELIGTAYYRLLRQATHDDVLRQTCDLMLADEDGHLQFHAERIACWQARWGPFRRGCWTAQLRLFLAGAAHLAWIDHRRALLAVGAGQEQFLKEVRRELDHFTGRPAPLVLEWPAWTSPRCYWSSTAESHPSSETPSREPTSTASPNRRRPGPTRSPG